MLIKCQQEATVVIE